MRILLVGANGLLGRAVHATLTEGAGGDEVVTASRSSGEPVDLTDAASIAALYSRVGTVDAVACTAGVTPFAPLPELSLGQYQAGLTDKLLGQIALVRLGLDHVTDGGSFTLISGILGEDPIATGSVAATVNGGLYAFVRAAAIELPRGLRINTVSPTVFTEAWDDYGPYFPGYPPVPVADAARGFVKSIAGRQTGQVYRIGY
jgi:NAD(P)-dependent dehydrogenase (short-subunit alcohol dehydrogenase family)